MNMITGECLSFASLGLQPDSDMTTSRKILSRYQKVPPGWIALFTYPQRKVTEDYLRASRLEHIGGQGLQFLVQPQITYLEIEEICIRVRMWLENQKKQVPGTNAVLAAAAASFSLPSGCLSTTNGKFMSDVVKRLYLSWLYKSLQDQIYLKKWLRRKLWRGHKKTLSRL